jgi:hypothetical protein
MFTKNTQFRVTIRDFQDRCEPQVLKDAGRIFVRSVREASADYLENCHDIDADLLWTVTLHQEFKVGTLHYVVFREGHGYEGKCLVWDLSKEPSAERPWTPIIIRPGDLRREFAYDPVLDTDLMGVMQPREQNFYSYFFPSWIPVARISANMVEENTAYTLIGAGFSTDLVLGTPEFPIGMAKTLTELRDLHNSVVKNHNTMLKESGETRSLMAGREYEFDQRVAKNTLALKVNYLKIESTDRPETMLPDTSSFEAVFQEGGWLDGAFAKAAVNPQFVSLATWLNTVDFDTL